MENKITTLISTSFSQAQLLKSMLDDCGIQSYIINQNLIQSSVSKGVKIRVNLDQLDEALAVVRNFNNNIDSEKHLIQNNSYINRILLPVDLSNFSEDLCYYALDLAKKYKADILLFNAYFSANVEIINFRESYTYDSKMVEVLADLRKSAEKKLIALKTKLNDKIECDQISDVEIDHLLEPGNPHEQIKFISEKYKPDLIIMGSKGQSSQEKDVLGEVISSVIEYVSIPLLILSEQGIKTKLDNIENVMYATNFEKQDFKAVANLKLICSPYNVSVSCVHFENVNSKRNLILNKHRMAVLDKYLFKLFEENDVKSEIIIVEDKQEDISTYIENNNIGAVAILARKHGFLEKLFNVKMNRKLFIETHVPILIFH